MCICPPRTGWTAAWRGTWRRPRPTSGRRCSGSRWRNWRPGTASCRSRRSCWPGTPRRPPAGPGCRTRPWRGLPRLPGRLHRAGLGRPAQGRGGRGRGGEHRRPGAARGEVPPVAAGVLARRPAYWPIFAACEQHGLLALFHTGTSGIGARQPGGQGIRIDYAHPLKLDPVAAAHPELTMVAAHFGWPWHLDLIAIALHKTNVYIDISGWSPRRIPAEVIRELRGRLSGQFLWGSDYPVLHARAVPVRARRPRPADRRANRGAARQRRAHPQLRSTTTGAWSDGPLPLRASRST